jgi:hypothetical protein
MGSTALVDQGRAIAPATASQSASRTKKVRSKRAMLLGTDIRQALDRAGNYQSTFRKLHRSASVPISATRTRGLGAKSRMFLLSSADPSELLGQLVAFVRIASEVKLVTNLP